MINSYTFCEVCCLSFAVLFLSLAGPAGPESHNLLGKSAATSRLNSRCFLVAMLCPCGRNNNLYLSRWRWCCIVRTRCRYRWLWCVVYLLWGITASLYILLLFRIVSGFELPIKNPCFGHLSLVDTFSGLCRLRCLFLSRRNGLFFPLLPGVRLCRCPAIGCKCRISCIFCPLSVITCTGNPLFACLCRYIDISFVCLQIL